MTEIIEYAPIAIVILAFLFKHKIFITPEQLKNERLAIKKEVEEKFLSIVAFRQFERRIDDNFKNNSNRFDKIDVSLEHIKDILINHNH